MTMDTSDQGSVDASSSGKSTLWSQDRLGSISAGAPRNLRRPLILVLLFLMISTLVSLWVGYRLLDLNQLLEDETARSLFFRLRLPRVVLAGILGASLGSVGRWTPAQQ